MDLKQILAHACHFNHTSVCELHLKSEFNWTETIRTQELFILTAPIYFSPLHLRKLELRPDQNYFTHTAAYFTVREALLVSWPGTVPPGWGGWALWIPAECLWPLPACCLSSIEGGGLSPSQCWRLRMGSSREFWRQASTETRGLSLSWQNKQD